MNTLAGIIVASISLLVMLLVGYHAVEELVQSGSPLAAFFMATMITLLAIAVVPFLYYFTKNFRESK